MTPPAAIQTARDPVQQAETAYQSGNDTFRSLILPEALRAILTRALIIDGENPDDVDDGGNWTPWMRYVKEFYREEFPQADNDADKNNAAISDWIDGAVATFTTQRFRAKSFYEGAQRK